MSNVTFKRSPNVNSIPIVDGQLIFDETNNKIYMDNGEQRLQYGGDVALISSVDYATANNAFSALATTELFLNKNTVVDSKTDALAATEQGLPVGCLAFQSAIGQADYSSIDNTISACLLTINNKFTSQLKANNNDIYMDYHDGKYGVNTSSTRGADTFIPFRGDWRAVIQLNMYINREVGNPVNNRPFSCQYNITCIDDNITIEYLSGTTNTVHDSVGAGNIFRAGLSSITLISYEWL